MKDIASDLYTLDDVFREGWGVFAGIFRKCAPIVFACAFVAEFLADQTVGILPLEKLLAPLREGQNGEAMYLKAETQISAYILGVFNFLILNIAQIATMKFAEAHITQRQILFGDALRETFRRYPRALWTVFLGGLITMGMTFLLIVPGIIWSVYYLFALYVAAMTSLSGKRALDYSKSLVKGSFWRTAGFFCCIGITAALVSMIIALAGASLVNLVPEKGQTFANAALNGISSLTSIFTLSLGTVFFLNTAYIRRKSNEQAAEAIQA